MRSQLVTLHPSFCDCLICNMLCRSPLLNLCSCNKGLVCSAVQRSRRFLVQSPARQHAQLRIQSESICDRQRPDDWALAGHIATCNTSPGNVAAHSMSKMTGCLLRCCSSTIVGSPDSLPQHSRAQLMVSPQSHQRHGWRCKFIPTKQVTCCMARNASSMRTAVSISPASSSILLLMSAQVLCSTMAWRHMEAVRSHQCHGALQLTF